MNTDIENLFKDTVIGHPAGLFVLFFTEMWERFSYYGMRALLVLFFTASLLDEGWGWPREHAFAIFGTYTSLVYLSTMLGGYFADKKIGYRWAVVIGALLMTIGHACMAIETPFFIYSGLTFLVFGSGFFKPNMTSIISEMYKGKEEKKDGAYTIFYMGVNAGAFLGILLCGYLGEKIGWSWGFGLAGVFMLFGLLQFWFAKNIFGQIGKKPIKAKEISAEDIEKENKIAKFNPFTKLQLSLIITSAILGLTWILNDPISKITEGQLNLFDFSIFGFGGSTFIIILALVLFILLLIIRIPKYDKITRDRMLAIVFFAFITMFFWSIFEQSPSSLTIFAKDYTNRILVGKASLAFKIINSLMAIVPLAIITWVLFLLFKKTFKKYALSNIILSLSFVIIWIITFFVVIYNFNSSSYGAKYSNLNEQEVNVDLISSNKHNVGDNVKIIDNQSLSFFNNEEGKYKIENNRLFSHDNKLTNDEVFKVIIKEYKEVIKKGTTGVVTNYAVVTFKNSLGNVITKQFLVPDKIKDSLAAGSVGQVIVGHNVKYDINQDDNSNNATISATSEAVEIPASWFGILNSLFIIMLAPLFSKWWESKYNPSANMKYAIGMFLLGLGMAVIAIGSADIAVGAKTASVSIIWLILVYLFHTMGELCVSPVALSYVSKLVPGRMIAMMFGVWYLAVAIGFKLAGIFAEISEPIAQSWGLSKFFWLLTGIATFLSILSAITYPVIKKLMHGVR